MKPLIGITADLVTPKNARLPKAFAHIGYSDGVIAAGGIPVLIPPYTRDEVLEEYLERLDGVLMTGGLDLNPRKMGKRPHPSIRTMLPRREESDRMLARMVIERKMSCLAVGVSMQMINVLMGGSLYTHLPEDMPRGIPHFDPVDPDHRHGVFITPRTRLEEIYGEGEIRVNSVHHQGIRTLASGLRSGALSPDGLIEAYESINREWFMVGVQWHPESDSASALDRQLFEGFINSCGIAAEQPATRPALKIAA